MARRRKCKTCGNSFEPKGPEDQFCSALCRTTGCFVGGGGDTSKPISPEMRKVMEKKKSASSPKPEKPRKIRNGAEKYPRVHYMFTLPVGERLAVSSQFTSEEAEYSRRLARKMLMEERRLDDEIEWDSSSDEKEASTSYEGLDGGRLGESDDGTV